MRFRIGVARRERLIRGAPALRASGDARHVLEAHLAQELRRSKRSKATLADQVLGTVARHLAQMGSKISLGQIMRPWHVTLGKLLGLSYIE